MHGSFKKPVANLCQVLALALILGACSSPGEVENDEQETTNSAVVTVGQVGVGAPFDTAAACPDWRWIGLSTGGGCPLPAVNTAANAWRVQQLFPAVPHDPLAPPLPPSPLDAFCLYEQQTAEGKPKDILKLVEVGELARAERDCAAAAGAAEVGLAEALAPGLEEHFFSQAGRAEVPIGGPHGVQLAFLDTTRTAEDGKIHHGASRHGFTLAHLARKLLCDGENLDACLAQITTQLALPIVELGATLEATQQSERGGFFGFLGHLATAVHAETLRWQETGAAEPLILNLSVAWNPQHFGGLEKKVEDMPLPVQAVVRALEDAACRGVMVVAAAGNRGGGPDAGSGALLPASWEERRAPGLGDCAHLGQLDASRFAPPTVADPLVYAVAGVSSSGAPLANARSEAIPRLAAYGDHGVTSTGLEEGWTGIYTGSSVATAVVSSAAAAVWRHRPQLRRHQVMELLYASGDPLGRDALLVPSGQDEPPEVHRIALCQALRQACLGGFCEQLPPNLVPSCAPWSPAGPSLSSAITEYISQVSFATLDASHLKSVVGAVEPCTAEVHLYEAEKMPSSFCPADEFYGISDQHWLGPQPPDIPCPSCPLVKDPETLIPQDECQDVSVPYTLYIEIDPVYAGGVLSAPTLEVDGKFSSLPTEDIECLHPDEEKGLHTGDRLVVRCVEGASIKANSKIELSFLASLHGSVRNSVMVVD